ncbi:MAG TPA: hypothetical protein VFV50_19620, partial [Bdellovibrionales bacterium]|nr:hypothetical protein [Bdellovibrionales bacterium]
MTRITLTLMSVFFAFSAAASADPRASYEMRGAFTDLFDHDVDYYGFPIDLKRTSGTNGVHWVEFNVNSYRRYCVYYQEQCVKYNDKGQCVQYQKVCAQYDYYVSKVPKRIELDFRKAATLDKTQSELYELTIQRTKPFDEGEDRVNTWLNGKKTVSPVRIRKSFD